MDPITVGKYQLLDRIGSGGMAEVHLARVLGAAGFEKLVVVKRLLPALAEEKDYVAQFVDEARLASKFSHANVVSTFDFGEADQSYYIAMEYIEGKNLRRVQDVLERRGKKLPAPAAIHIIAEACRGLDYAHSRKDELGNPLQVVHRDVSPQNIVVSYSGDVKVLDFGIAKSSAREFKTQAGIVKGKLRYMSPEQVAGEDIDGRSDLFGAAVILWELFFGKRWMPDLPDTELVHWVKRGEFTMPPGAPRPPADLQAILDKALAVNREDRYATAGDFARALSRYNSQRWPDFTATDLARLLDTEFGEDMRRERAWIAGILGGMAASTPQPTATSPSNPSVRVRTPTNPGFMPPSGEVPIPGWKPPPAPDAGPFRTNGEAPTVQTPTGGVKSAELPIVRGVEPLRTPTPSGSRSIPSGLPQAPERAATTPTPPPTIPPEGEASLIAEPKRSRKAMLIAGGVVALLVAALGGGAIGPLLFGKPTPSLTPTAIAKVSPVASPAASPAGSVIASPAASPDLSPSPVKTPIATHSLLVIAPSPSPKIRLHTPTPPIPTPSPSAVVTPVPANAARVSISVQSGWGEVWIDGKQVSKETPLMNYSVAPGPHEIWIVKNNMKSVSKVVLHSGTNPPVVLPLPR